MNEKKIVVPEGMLQEASDAHRRLGKMGAQILTVLEAALRWLSENPIVPSEEQLSELWNSGLIDWNNFKWRDIPTLWCEIQRRMFLAPEPEVPECRQEVFGNKHGTTVAVVCSCGFATTYTALSEHIGMAHFQKMHEAYRRGKDAR